MEQAHENKRSNKSSQRRQPLDRLLGWVRNKPHMASLQEGALLVIQYSSLKKLCVVGRNRALELSQKGVACSS